MRAFSRIAIFTAIFCSVAVGASAHPGSKTLTTGSGERTAMTTGMSYEDIKGVHIFRGRPAASSDASSLEAAQTKQIEIEISVRPVFRHFRHLRTQGFYSGVYPSHHYTQGFYSGW